jgi:hypothetical protein
MSYMGNGRALEQLVNHAVAAAGTGGGRRAMTLHEPAEALAPLRMLGCARSSPSCARAGGHPSKSVLLADL